MKKRKNGGDGEEKGGMVRGKGETEKRMGRERKRARSEISQTYVH